MLVGRGFSLDQLYDLPLDVLDLYFAAHTRVVAQERIAYIFDVQAAVVAALSGSKAIREYVDNIREQI